MPRRHRSGALSRSPREWIMRGALALVVATTGYVSVIHSLAMTLSDKAPERASAMAPWDGRIAARASREMAGTALSAAPRARADRLALAALRMDPTAVPAVTTLGLSAQIRGQTAKARRLFAYSQELSRRDLQTQLWAIENAVGRGDIPGALENYDIALRTSRFTPELLYPVLTTAMNDPKIEQSLVATLSKKPLWTTSFIDYVASKGDATASARLFRDLAAARVPVSGSARTGVIVALIKEKRFADAWRFYRSFQPSANLRMSRNPDFRIAPEHPSPFDWQPYSENSGTSAVIQPSQQTGFFDFAVPATIGGVVLRQMQLLPSGTYVLEGYSRGIEQSADARPYWSLKCDDDRELGRADIQNSTQEGGRFGGRFTVPDDCQVQHLMLTIRPSNLISGVTGQIDRALLRPAN